RKMIDMHIQNKQVSFDVYTDFAHIQQVATPFEPTLKANLKKTGYEVTSIHYKALSKHVHKPFHSRTHMDRPEGFDIKILTIKKQLQLFPIPKPINHFPKYQPSKSDLW